MGKCRSATRGEGCPGHEESQEAEEDAAVGGPTQRAVATVALGSQGCGEDPDACSRHHERRHDPHRPDEPGKGEQRAADLAEWKPADRQTAERPRLSGSLSQSQRADRGQRPTTTRCDDAGGGSEERRFECHEEHGAVPVEVTRPPESGHHEAETEEPTRCAPSRPSVVLEGKQEHGNPERSNRPEPERGE